MEGTAGPPSGAPGGAPNRGSGGGSHAGPYVGPPFGPHAVSDGGPDGVRNSSSVSLLACPTWNRNARFRSRRDFRSTRPEIFFLVPLSLGAFWNHLMACSCCACIQDRVALNRHFVEEHRRLFTDTIGKPWLLKSD